MDAGAAATATAAVAVAAAVVAAGCLGKVHHRSIQNTTFHSGARLQRGGKWKRRASSGQFRVATWQMLVTTTDASTPRVDIVSVCFFSRHDYFGQTRHHRLAEPPAPLLPRHNGTRHAWLCNSPEDAAAARRERGSAGGALPAATTTNGRSKRVFAGKEREGTEETARGEQKAHLHSESRVHP